MENLGNKRVMADNLLYYLGKHDMSQMELAEIVGAAPSTVSEWVRANKYPRIDKIETMAKYFGISKSDLIEERTVGSIPQEAYFHGKILRDKKVLNMLKKYYSLNNRDQQIVINFVESFVPED